MRGISERDWEAVNAYRDGELPDLARRAFERRIYREPDLAAALAEVTRLHGALAALRPAPASPGAAPARPRAALTWLAAGAVIVVIGLGGYLATRAGTGLSPQDLHAAFAGAPVEALPEARIRQVRAFGAAGLPDLSAARLVPVAVRSLSDTRVAAHYAGENGCRLTLVADGNGAELTLPEGANFARWQTERAAYALVATGMDAARFAAVARYVRDALDQTASPGTRLALKDATDAAPPCGRA